MKTFSSALVAQIIIIVPGVLGAGFDFDQVRSRAHALAAQPYQSASNSVPTALGEMSYAQHNAIRFRREQALWRGKLPFFIELIHPGAAQRNLVSMHEIVDGQEIPVPFSAALFDYGTNGPPAETARGFSGFRVFYAPENFGEAAAFAGATYFRMIGSGQNYGSSARALAINTATPVAEDFPVFTDFWLVRPSRSSRELTVFGLFDGTNAAGALRWVIQPGPSTVAKIDAVIFLRGPVERVGLAPLTSMFLHDQNNHIPFRDFRPEVHDCDALLVHTAANEWWCRHLAGAKAVRVDSYHLNQPRGFGLLQRDRNFEHYQDFDAKFQLRPSVWIAPVGKWPEGALELIQFPSDIEFSDNVVALWHPTKLPPPGQPLALSYTMEWTRREMAPKDLGRAIATRLGKVPKENGQPWNVRIVIDFGGEALGHLSAANALAAEIHGSEGSKLVADTVVKNENNQTWRLVIEMTEPQKPVQLQARLLRRGAPITETWLFTYEP